MADLDNLEEYEINEKDIDSVLNFLKIFDPEKATPEHAIDFIEFYQTEFHKLGHTASDEDMEKLYAKFSTQDPQI